MAVLVGGSRISLRIKGPDYSWSENYHSIFTNLTDARNAGFVLAANRAVVLTGDCLILEQRISFELPSGSTKTRLQPVAANGQPVQGSIGSVLGEENVRILLNMFDANGNGNHIFLGGVPYNAVQEDEKLDGNYLKALQNFGSLIGQGGSSGIAVRSLSHVAANTNLNVTNIAQVLPRGAQLTVTGYAGATGTILRVKSSSSLYAGLSGLKKIIIGGASPISIGGATPIGVFGPVVLPNVITVTQEDVTYAAAVLATPIRATRRAAGRPFDLAVGRRPNRIPLRR